MFCAFRVFKEEKLCAMIYQYKIINFMNFDIHSKKTDVCSVCCPSLRKAV